MSSTEISRADPFITLILLCSVPKSKWNTKVQTSGHLKRGLTFWMNGGFQALNDSKKKKNEKQLYSFSYYLKWHPNQLLQHKFTHLQLKILFKMIVKQSTEAMIQFSNSVKTQKCKKVACLTKPVMSHCWRKYRVNWGNTICVISFHYNEAN